MHRTYAAGVVLGFVLTQASPAAADTGSRVQAGGHHTCVRQGDGTVECWGSNTSGQLGDGTTTLRTTRTPVPGLSNVVDLSAGREHTCAVDAAGDVWCWGSNAYGQLGASVGGLSTTPVRAGVSGVVQISAGAYHTCAVRHDGTAWCWGYNVVGQLGDGTQRNQARPTQVPGLSSLTEISAGGAGENEGHTCALDESGWVWCWGDDEFGQIGDGNGSGGAVLTPTLVDSLDDDVVQLATGSNHTCALGDSGAVWCWGRDYSGQVGDALDCDENKGLVAFFTGVTGPCNHYTPTRVVAPELAVHVSAGGGHSCMTGVTGATWCWGYNHWGQLGDGTRTNRSAPVRSALAQLAQASTTGLIHTCAVVGDSLWCWGNNSRGQLGDGTMNDRTLPTEVD